LISSDPPAVRGVGVVGEVRSGEEEEEEEEEEEAAAAALDQSDSPTNNGVIWRSRS
jgi:hypothetical protein